MLSQQINLNSNSQKNRKRTYSQMISQPKLLYNPIENEINNLCDNFESKKKKIISENDEYYKLNMDKEIILKLQSELKKLQIQNYSLKAINSEEDIDMPVIEVIPINKKYLDEKLLIFNSSYYVDDDADTNNTSINLDSEISSVCLEDKIKGKIIDNAIKTEKTMMKYFDSYNPNLQPNKENGLILYKDMTNIQNKLDSNLLASYIVTSYNEGKRKKEFEMDIDTLNTFSVFNNEEEIEFDSIVNNNEFIYYDMFLD